MQTVERERREDEEDDFTVVDQHGKVYNDNAGMDGIVVQIDIRDYLRMPDVLKDKLLRRLTGGYEVVAPPVDRSAIPDLRTSELFYDCLARSYSSCLNPDGFKTKVKGGFHCLASQNHFKTVANGHRRPTKSPTFLFRISITCQ
jgi:hypothetical protein